MDARGKDRFVGESSRVRDRAVPVDVDVFDAAVAEGVVQFACGGEVLVRHRRVHEGEVGADIVVRGDAAFRVDRGVVVRDLRLDDLRVVRVVEVAADRVVRVLAGDALAGAAVHRLDHVGAVAERVGERVAVHAVGCVARDRRDRRDVVVREVVRRHVLVPGEVADAERVDRRDAVRLLQPCAERRVHVVPRVLDAEGVPVVERLRLHRVARLDAAPVLQRDRAADPVRQAGGVHRVEALVDVVAGSDERVQPGVEERVMVLVVHGRGDKLVAVDDADRVVHVHQVRAVLVLPVRDVLIPERRHPLIAPGLRHAAPPAPEQ